MCGIAGILDFQSHPSQTGGVVDRMLQTLQHRGPDYSSRISDGPVSLGHSRLSIIDLQSHSNQPMTRGPLTITYNGEVYNYKEIRQELEVKGHVFSTKSDTEVVLAAYAQWGEECVNRFMGMWAFAIWDTRSKTIFCSRDRFGIKPFYYIDRNGVFAFASEVRALKQLSIFSNEINERQVYRGLQLGWTQYGEETYYQFVKILPAGTNLTVSQSTRKELKYWDLHRTEQINGTDEMTEDAFRQLFIQSVGLHSRSDVSVGACLSGGLDSSAIVSTFCHLFPEQKIKTFTIFYDGDKEVDERPWVNHLLDQYPQVESYCYTPGEKDISGLFYTTQDACEFPLTGSSPVSQHLLMKVAAQHGVKVLLDGQGSDEYLAGYLHTFDRLFGQMIRQKRFLQAVKGIIHHSRNQALGVNNIIYLMMKSLLSSVNNEQDMLGLAYRNLPAKNVIGNKAEIPFRLNPKQECDQLSQFLYDLVFTTSLPTLLHYEDRNSMHYSIESRVPFLDHRLVEYAFNLPSDSKIRNGETKSILRRSLRGIMPDPIAARKDKEGFVTPGEKKWLNGPLRELLEVDFRNADFIDAGKAGEMMKLYKSGRGNAQTTWRLATLNHWLRTA